MCTSIVIPTNVYVIPYAICPLYDVPVFDSKVSLSWVELLILLIYIISYILFHYFVISFYVVIYYIIISYCYISILWRNHIDLSLDDFPLSGEQPEQRLIAHISYNHQQFYSNISKILLLPKTWGNYNKLNSTKSLRVCYWYVWITQCGYMEHGLRYLKCYVKQQIAAPWVICYNPPLVRDNLLGTAACYGTRLLSPSLSSPYSSSWSWW